MVRNRMLKHSDTLFRRDRCRSASKPRKIGFVVGRHYAGSLQSSSCAVVCERHMKQRAKKLTWWQRSGKIIFQFLANFVSFVHQKSIDSKDRCLFDLGKSPGTGVPGKICRNRVFVWMRRFCMMGSLSLLCRTFEN